MKKIVILSFSVFLATAGFSQGIKDKVTNKVSGGGGKGVEPAEGEYSDPTGLSGTYYTTSDLPYGDTKKMIKVVKLEFKAEENSVTMHAMKGETDPTVLYMPDYRKYGRDNFKISHFQGSDFHLIAFEPGVAVFGQFKWAPKDYPGYTPGMMIADTSVLKPVILVKDSSMISKYSYNDARRIMGEQGTLSEVINSIRVGDNTPVPSIGAMNSDKELIAKSVELMKAKWADSKEPANFVTCYIHSNDWGTVQYGKALSEFKTTLSDEVLVIMVFKEPSNGLVYYYSIGISRESEDFTADGVTTERGLHMTGNSTIQYLTQAKLDALLVELGEK